MFGSRSLLLSIGATVAFFLLLSFIPLHPLFRPSYVHCGATIILLFYLWGYAARRDLKRHVRLMLCGMLLDIGLTAYHEIGLRVFSRLMGLSSFEFAGSEMLLQVHIWVSAALLGAYVVVWYSGRMRVPADWLWLPALRNSAVMRGLSARRWKRAHLLIGYLVLILSFLSWLTAPYFVLEWLLAVF